MNRDFRPHLVLHVYSGDILETYTLSSRDNWKIHPSDEFVRPITCKCGGYKLL